MKENETEINQILREAEIFLRYASPRDGLMIW